MDPDNQEYTFDAFYRIITCYTYILLEVLKCLYNATLVSALSKYNSNFSSNTLYRQYQLTSTELQASRM